MVQVTMNNQSHLQHQVNSLSAMSSAPIEIKHIPVELTMVLETELQSLWCQISKLKNTTTAIPHTRVCIQHPKVGDPSLFSGKKEELEGFLAGLNVVFAL